MYATDVAKMIEAPIFHVNGDDPLAVKFVTDMALDFRQEFGRDVVIDMYCYRKYGHQEVDEPSFTQPDLYARIDKHPSVAELYKRQLLGAGILSEDDAASLETEFQLRLDLPLENVKAREKEKTDEQAKFKESTAVFQPEYTSESEPTAISEETLATIVNGLTRVPDGFDVQPKIKRIVLGHQRKVFEAGGPYEWHYAEALAFGSLLLEGIPIRLSGQDSARGTFSTRHSVLYDAKTGEPYVPLMHLAEKQARICIYNSQLSEAAVLGFDYGYSLDYPKMLCLWEAQFGDFANGAQVIIDQFIVSAESKWQRPSGIVLLLFAPADETRFPQTAHHYDAQKSLARPIRFFVGRRIHSWPVRGNSRLARGWTSRQSEADHLLLGQSLLRSAQLSDRAQDRRRGNHSRRTALSVGRKKVARNAQAISKEREVCLVPGRTAKYGRVEFH